MKSGLILIVSAALLATSAEAGSRSTRKTTTMTRTTQTRHTVVGAPVPHRGPARQEHGNGHGHAVQQQWPIPHVGPT